MSDLNNYLHQEMSTAHQQGREVCFHVSATLTATINQVQQTGMITNSFSDPDEFLEFIDNIGRQFHPFNTAKLVAMDCEDYLALDPQQKLLLSHIMDEIVGEATLIVKDNTGINRLFVGPLIHFQFFHPVPAASGNQNSLIPNFQLNPGLTWAPTASAATNNQALPPHLHPLAPALIATSPGRIINRETPPPVKSATRIPRPPNPFIIYRAAHHKAISDANPDASNNEISKKIGRQWQNETTEVREYYRQKAAEIKSAFMRAHPDYKYKPRKSSEIKHRAKKSDNESQETSDQSED